MRTDVACKEPTAHAAVWEFAARGVGMPRVGAVPVLSTHGVDSPMG